jgi:hypothetical protein
MTEASATTLFDGGPPTRLQTALRLEKPGQPRLAQRATLVALIGWLPLAVLAVAHGQGDGGFAMGSFFSDFATYARSLVAAPLLILAERDCLPKLGAVAGHFLSAGLVPDSERPRFGEAVSSTRRLLDSQSVEILVVILAYFATAALIRFSSEADKPQWLRSGGDVMPHLSLAEGWYVFVSRPLFLILILGWSWRQFLWVRFLWLMSGLDLRLVPSHPDQVGGLRFISSSLRGYRLLCGSLGVVGAGITANRVVHEGASPMVLKNAAIAIVAVILLLFVAPLTIFLKQLRHAKKRGIFEYGALAAGLGLQFERKWLTRNQGVDADALSAPDFSATTDLYSVAANAYAMKELPFGLKNIGNLVLAALIPFVPIAILAVPLKVVLKELTKLVF